MVKADRKVRLIRNRARELSLKEWNDLQRSIKENFSELKPVYDDPKKSYPTDYGYCILEVHVASAYRFSRCPKALLRFCYEKTGDQQKLRQMD